MNTSNRQVTTNFNERREMPMTIEVLKDTRYYGKLYRAGQEIEVSRSEAKRLMTVSREYFRIKAA